MNFKVMFLVKMESVYCLKREFYKCENYDRQVLFTRYVRYLTQLFQSLFLESMILRFNTSQKWQLKKIEV